MRVKRRTLALAALVASLLVLLAVFDLNSKQHTASPNSSPINVVTASDSSNAEGILALFNSILHNTRTDVQFHLITDHTSAGYYDKLLQRTFPTLRVNTLILDERRFEGKIKVRGARQSLSHPLNYARYLIPELLAHVDTFVYLDNDVIVQGDIAELASAHVGEYGIALSSDCTWLSDKYDLFKNSYKGFLNFNNPRVSELGIDPNTCSFNAGVFVASANVWREQNMSDKLMFWLQANVREDIYGSGDAGGGSQPPMMIVFYKKYHELDPLWHVRSLGSGTSSSLPTAVAAHDAKLVHFTGRTKPWSSPDLDVARFRIMYHKYRVPLPRDMQ